MKIRFENELVFEELKESLCLAAQLERTGGKKGLGLVLRLRKNWGWRISTKEKGTRVRRRQLTGARSYSWRGKATWLE